MENAETAETAEGPLLHLQQKDLYLHLHLQPHWRKSMSDHTPRTAKKSTDNFGRPASTNSDFSYGLYLNLD